MSPSMLIRIYCTHFVHSRFVNNTVIMTNMVRIVMYISTAKEFYVWGEGEVASRQ